MSAMTATSSARSSAPMPPVKPDPGRMTAHRLNRNEYTNTIRDLLGIRFRAERDFPVDDSADGFDNIGDVLTVSPLLMERYLSAAERIAGWALATDNLPAKPLEIGYLAREQRIRRTDRSTIEAEHRVEFAGEYIVRFGLPGERPAIEGVDAAPVTLGFWMDGTLLATQTVETKPSGLVYFNPYSEEEFRLYLPEGDHVFRAGFIDDVFVKTLPERGLVQPAEEQVPRRDHLRRTVPVEDRKGNAQEDPLLQSRVGPRLCRDDPRRSRAARLPPAADTRRSRFASALRGPREVQRAVRSSRDCSSPSRRCWCRRISCSASSAIRIRAIRRSCTKCRRSSSRRASAISSGARCRMRSC